MCSSPCLLTSIYSFSRISGSRGSQLAHWCFKASRRHILHKQKRKKKVEWEKKHLLNSSILSLTSILLGEHIMSYLIPLHSHGAEDCGVDFVNEDPYRMEISLILSRSPFSSASRYSFCACSFVTSGKKSLWIIFSKLCQQKQNTSRRLIQRTYYQEIWAYGT